MSEKSTIEWTDATWNPVRGCVKISPGCKHCYAETFAERFRGVPGHPYEQGFTPRLVPDQLDAPLRWREPRRVFVNSMSDLFGAFVPFPYIAAAFAVMGLACHHTYQLLTKRAERLPQVIDALSLGICLDMLRDAFPWVRPTKAQRTAIHDALPATSPFRADSTAHLWPLPNTWLGVSVEDRTHGVPRIEALRRTPATVRFVSIEPLLEDVGKLNLTGIHQVIVGAESGRRARPMNEDWVRSLRDQAKDQGVAFFYKQRLERGRKVSLPMLDGQQWAELPG